MEPTAPKPIVVACTRAYLPGSHSGGPVRATSNLVDALGDEFDFRIITSDRDGESGKRLDRVALDRWITVGKAQVYYASTATTALAYRIPRLISAIRCDVLYLNSFFDPVFTLQPMLAWHLGMVSARKLVVAPRGEMAREARAHRAWKKIPYLKLAAAIGLFRDAIWQAGSEAELAEIESVLGRRGGPPLRIDVARDIVRRSAADGDTTTDRPPVSPGRPLRICTLARIVPTKNLDFALRALALVRSPVKFDIYGPREAGGYWARCERLIAAMPSHVQVDYRGPLSHDRVHPELLEHDLFLLPTQTESFGYAIVEAMAAGLPVLISDQTPWRDLQRAGCGWDLPLGDPARFAKVIDEVVTWDRAQADQASERARAYATVVREDVGSVQQSRALFS